MDLHYIHVRSSRVARSGCGLMRRWIHASVAKSGLTPVSWAPSLSVLRIIFNALFLTWGNATKTTCEGKQILLCGFCLFTQVNYCGNFITAPSLVHGFKTTIQHLFPFCLVAVGQLYCPEGMLSTQVKEEGSLCHREPELETREK